MIRIDEIIKITNAKVIFADEKDLNTDITKFSTDTRTISTGDFYIPLKGANFDGENFIDKAIESGAVGYFTTTGKIEKGAKFALQVENTLTAYLQLANYRRNQVNPKVVMITGSSGKTTTKELVYSVCSQKFNTIKTSANHNNEIGFCQTVFSITDDTEVLIIEAGMRGFGEIELISKYAEPDISIISNVGTAHIGRLGSRENIAKAKCEITSHQRPKGILIAHDNELIKNNVNYNGRKIYYSINDVKILKKEIGRSEYEYKNHKYTLNIEGDYNIENSIAAIETGLELGISSDLIAKGLEEYKSIEKRWEIEEINGYNIINDSYNANPESMKATLNTIFDLYPNCVIVLGNMGELGENEVQYHKEVADFINSKNISSNTKILTVGDLAKHISNNIKTGFTKNFNSNDEVSDYILNNIEKGATIFFKASRSMKLEEIISNLRNKKGENIK